MSTYRRRSSNLISHARSGEFLHDVSVEIARHRLWHGAWLFWLCTVALGTAMPSRPAASAPGAGILAVASTALAIVAVRSRAHLLSPRWLRRRSTITRGDRASDHRETTAQGTRALACTWAAAVALAAAGTCAAVAGDVWLAAADVIFAAAVLLASPPKLLADTS